MIVDLTIWDFIPYYLPINVVEIQWMNEWTESFGRRLKHLCPIHQERTEVTDINIM